MRNFKSPWGQRKVELEARFWSKVDWDIHNPGCWEWKAAKDPNGYGRFGFAGEVVLAHRLAYELEVGEILLPHLDHKCRNTSCVNPDHLEPVTVRENGMRGKGTGTEAHCRDGHLRSPGNTYIKPNGGPACRPCRTERTREFRLRRRARK